MGGLGWVEGGWTCASSRCCCLLLIAWFLIEWIMYADRFSIASSCVRRRSFSRSSSSFAASACFSCSALTFCWGR